ncbi:MAG: SH3 domain-containing protein [Marinomonas sp.]
MIRHLLCLLAAIGTLLTSTGAAAQSKEVPYWASVRWTEVNMRVGPSENYKIEWVYKRPGLPLKVVRKAEGWRLVQDPDGTQGWVTARSLVLKRTAIVAGEGLAAMRAEPNASAAIKWNAQVGVVGGLGDCEAGYCEFDVSGRKGWVRENRLWGAGKP